MRGLAVHVSSPGIKALDIWDVPVASIVAAGSIGEVLDDLTAAKIAYIDAPISGAVITYYSYSGALADTTNFVPAQKTIVMIASLAGVAATDEFRLISTNAGELAIARINFIDGAFRAGFHGCLMCDGTNNKFYNRTGGAETLNLYGMSLP